ncbi:MAG: 2,3,4,5-tetrahydropyridine-2,6-dicarboxylate N-succinyltransferase [Holosporales bacterium]|jgi:2,3,4,5-tetrahydropyridine-2-carboxylate N-succinyltransferase|nr:2,3,4,5-tetrahydropyridine-2,6-dicarboxylate N-succinyltransferase [Holosporales bacterium]
MMNNRPLSKPSESELLLGDTQCTSTQQEGEFGESSDLQTKIESLFNGQSELNELDTLACIDEVFALLESGKIRVAVKSPGGENANGGKWIVSQWIKKAILLAFKFRKSMKREFDSFDKLGLLEFDYEDPTYRKVPNAVIREGTYIGKNAVIMQSYINTGAYIGDGTMVDINAAIGSCAQIGSRCHIAAQACIGGVLEPVAANPVIIEDNCFIGVHSSVLEGVLVEEDAIIAPGVNLTASTKIIDRQTGEVFRGVVPSGAVVVPGSYPSNGLNIACGVIVKTVDSQTKSKTGINEILRDAD